MLLSGIIGLFKMNNDFKMSNIIFGMIGKLDIKSDQRGEKHNNTRKLKSFDGVSSLIAEHVEAFGEHINTMVEASKIKDNLATI